MLKDEEIEILLKYASPKTCAKLTKILVERKFSGGRSSKLNNPNRE